MAQTDPAPACACDEIAEGLLDFVEGDLSADANEQFEAQVRGCDYCTDLLRTYTAVGGLVRAAMDVTVDEDLQAELDAALFKALGQRA